MTELEPPCTRPSHGWRCTRRHDHPGPCAAVRVCRFSWRLPVWLCLAGIVVAALVDLGCPRSVDADQVDHPRGRVTIVRPLTATDQEAEEGYFALEREANADRDLTLVVKQGSDLHRFLRAKVGRKVMLVIADAE